MTTSGVERILLLTPGLLGRDGVATVSRDAWLALERVRAPREAWSLHDPQDLQARIPGAWGACGSRVRLASLAARRGLRPWRNALVVSMHLHLAPVGLALWCLGARHVVFLHGIEAWQPLPPLRRAALMRSTLIANSAHTGDRFLRANPAFRRHPLRVCHLGVGDAPAPAALPAGLQPGFALAVGRLHEGYKGHDELLDAWPAVLLRAPRARLVVAGDGPDRARLEGQVARRGLGASVRLVGTVSDTVREALYAACSFFALPSREEGFGVVYLEAMRAGKACLAGPGAPAEVVVHERTGLVVDPRDGPRLVDALVRLFVEGDLRESWGAAGRARQQELFTHECFARRLLQALEVA